MNIQKIDNGNISFNSASKKQFKKLAEIIETNNPNFSNKPDMVANLYKDGIEFLNGKIKKKNYLDKLEKYLNEYNTQNHLSMKEAAFLENLEIAFENNPGLKGIKKEDLANHLSILA